MMWQHTLLLALVSLLGYVSGFCESSSDKLLPNTKMCRKQCNLVGQTVEPKFDQWEEYCHKTSRDSDWDELCKDFYACVFGCANFGGNRNQLLSVAGEARQTLMEKVNPRNTLKEEKCEVEKCRSYCSRQTFGTCKEVQFEQSCTKVLKTIFYSCTVDCSFASSQMALPTLFIALGWLVYFS